jgi:transcriptional regulator with XRE-family HTH domain
VTQASLREALWLSDGSSQAPTNVESEPTGRSALQWGLTGTNARVVLASRKRQVRATVFNRDMAPPEQRVGLRRTYKRSLRETRQRLARDLFQIRTDMAGTHGQVAALAGIDRSYFSRIEAGAANPSIETLTAIAVALGADLSIRFYPGSGPRLTDRHQARMIETLLRSLSDDWKPHLEVPVSRPVRGVIDVVLERRTDRLLVATEAYSELRRLEQQIRWSREKAGALGSSTLLGPGALSDVSTLLVLRSTASTRELARQFESTLAVAYPARTTEVLDSLRAGSAWPGPGIIWIRIEGERVKLLDGAPRGVKLGR